MSENIKNEQSENSRVHNLIRSGTEIAGGAISGALSLLSSEPLAAAALGGGGVVAASVLNRIGLEITNRLLGEREKVRVGGVLAIAAADIRQRMDKGEEIRADGFFDQSLTGRSDAEEVAEGVLLKSQREPEEKKIRYMGYLLSSLAFEQTISAQMAHQITKSAEQLTYRQFCLLKIFMYDNYRYPGNTSNIVLRDEDYRGKPSFPRELYQILYECFDLYSRGLVSVGGNVAFGPTDIAPRKTKVQGLGVDIMNLMRLVFIPEEDLLSILDQLQ